MMTTTTTTTTTITTAMTTTTTTTTTTATTITTAMTTTMIRIKLDKCEIYSTFLILYRLNDILRVNQIWIYFLLDDKCTSQLCMFHWGFTFHKCIKHISYGHGYIFLKMCEHICHGHSFIFLQMCEVTYVHEHIWWPQFHGAAEMSLSTNHHAINFTMYMQKILRQFEG